MNVFIVIPTYNEAKTIGPIVKNLTGRGYRVVTVDDGSHDHTIVDANRYGAELVVHSKNVGKGRCIREGLEYALENNCDAVITMDGDGQHDLREIDKFIDEYKRSGSDIILGNRMKNPKNMPFIRRCTNVFMSFIISLIFGRWIDDSQCGYRFLSKNAIEKMNLKTTKYEIESEMLLEAKRNKLSISSVEIDSIYRGQSSQINPFSDTIRFIKFIIHESLRRKT
ncbi:MAG: glycosyltransferase family 2 protein [Candidatus Omnitrophica bacterium]|nr:glycosyltransferase family 2 protein [Candidatus Omnitrophota bacterium]MBU4458120.1 glycosyltransferase family 2 protein [Candidatus Omnitrophota bacterium]